jgi:hypothetical protein
MWRTLAKLRQLKKKSRPQRRQLLLHRLQVLLQLHPPPLRIHRPPLRLHQIQTEYLQLILRLGITGIFTRRAV